jgi:hypothetical protein
MHGACFVALVFLVVLTACTPSGTSTPLVSTPNATATPSQNSQQIVPSRTPREPHNEPTSTPVPPTPLPTIPTFTPRFDVSTIVTVTPAPRAECPKENPTTKINFLIPKLLDDKNIGSPDLINDEKVLGYLNMGGSLPTLVANLETSVIGYKYQDFTGDGVKDLLIEHFAGLGYKDARIYICVHGVYQSFSAIAEDWAPLDHLATISTIKDLNKNGIPDIVISDAPVLIILEWRGSDFDRSLLR